MPHSKPETVAAHDLKVPEQLTRQEFIDLGVEVHTACGVQLEACACFREPHEDGQPHSNLLGRATLQFKWKAVADKFREKGAPPLLVPCFRSGRQLSAAALFAQMTVFAKENCSSPFG